MPATLCPFCLPDAERIAFVGPLVKGVWAASPVAEGHLLITPHRHVAGWRDLHPAERAAVMAGLDEAETLLQCRFAAEGWNVSFDDGPVAGQAIPHFHLNVIPRMLGDDPNALAQPAATEAPATALFFATPHRRALIAGGEDGLLAHLVPYIDRASRVDAAVSFVMESGVRLLRPHLEDLLERGGALRLLTGDYMDVTDPAALRGLLDLPGEPTLRVFEAAATGFHPKAWIFHFPDGSGVALAGSSNLSETALRQGVEWSLRLVTAEQAGGWREALEAFEALLARPEVRPLDNAWIDDYERRRRGDALDRPGVAEVAAEPARPVPFPHPIQQRALDALAATREAGYAAGLVVLATGLGKTWLSAFDTDAPEFQRVLFVAHREEILDQAFASFRAVRPRGRFGRYSGEAKDSDVDVLFASIQTLSRAAHLRRFPRDAFDYIVIDEFHHAAAHTYRALIDHFTPRFLLGMTATPERTDGGDLLGLCQENLVFECRVAEGIEAGLLCPFHYFGVPDAVEYSNIPWRGSGFDETGLTNALATRARADNALEQLRRHGGRRTLAFCCSQRHADFMAGVFNAAGRRSVAVHSGPASAPRSSSLQALGAGELDTVFAVDMFNEGVDVPAIDTILMLRPTASAIVWTQQFGRGLRRAEGKDHLSVIDYIGNHRAFLNSARVLLDAGPGDRDLAISLERARDRTLELPAGCEVTYDLEALDVLTRLLRGAARGNGLEAWYVDFKQRLGVRPTAMKLHHAGFDPKASGHGGWFDFVGRQGDVGPDEARVAYQHRDFLEEVSRTAMTRGFKMVLLRALQEGDALPGSMSLDDLVARFQRIAGGNPRLAADLGVPVDDARAVRESVRTNPIAAWSGRLDARGRPFFTFDGKTLSANFSVEPELRPAFDAMTRELIDWRLAQYLGRAQSADTGPADGVGTAPAIPWREYRREEIPPLFGLRFKRGSWNQGFVVERRHVFLLVTLEKADLQTGRTYDDKFLSADRFQWHSQNRATRDSAHGRIIGSADRGHDIHLFVRAGKLRGGLGAPFWYCGDVDFETWSGDAPMLVEWRLREPAPEHLRRLLGIP